MSYHRIFGYWHAPAGLSASVWAFLTIPPKWPKSPWCESVSSTHSVRRQYPLNQCMCCIVMDYWPWCWVELRTPLSWVDVTDMTYSISSPVWVIKVIIGCVRSHVCVQYIEPLNRGCKGHWGMYGYMYMASYTQWGFTVALMLQLYSEPNCLFWRYNSNYEALGLRIIIHNLNYKTILNQSAFEPPAFSLATQATRTAPEFKGNLGQPCRLGGAEQYWGIPWCGWFRSDWDILWLR